MDKENFSALMSLYKNEHASYLSEALQSLCEQTISPSEVIIVKDGEITAELQAIIDEFSGKLNIKEVQLEQNVGLAKALNYGLNFCSYEYVARMDSDDISLPRRFELQLEFLRNHPEISVLSCALEEFDDEGNVFGKRTLPGTHDELVKFAKLRSPISHAAAMFRKSSVIAVGGYPEFRRSQDVALWSLMLTKGFRFANLKQVLFRVRANVDFMKRNGMKNLKYELSVILYQKKIGFLSFYECSKAAMLRIIIAIIPARAKKVIYGKFKR